MKKFLKLITCSICLLLLLPRTGAIEAKNCTFVLDPGHGGPHPGCVYSYDGKTILEKELNLKIAKYLQNELQKYETQKGKKVVVHLTRTDDDTAPNLEERVLMAKSKKAKALISLHNNACGYPENSKNGCMVLVTSSNYNDLYQKEHDLAKSIIKQLNKIGIKTAPISDVTEANEGLLRRLSDDGSTYPNGDTTDWYGIIRHGVNHNIPSILVEHAYLSNEQDYRKFLSSDKKLKKLAKADAKGIAKYYNLKLKDKKKSLSYELKNDPPEESENNNTYSTPQENPEVQDTTVS